MDSNQVKNGIIQARLNGIFAGWYVLFESFIVSILAFAWSNNALVGLAAFVVGFALLSQRIVGQIVSIAFAGLIGWWAYQTILSQSARWDFGAAAGLVAAFLAYKFRQKHVRAFEEP